MSLPDSSRLDGSPAVVTDSPHSSLRLLPIPARLVISVGLISVGLGYFSALIQLHFAGGAKAGEPLPGKEEVRRTYGPGEESHPVTRLEQLLEVTDGPFTGKGTMRPAFTTKSMSGENWQKKLDKLKEAKGDDAVKKLLDEREGERKAMIAWIRAGGGQNEESKKDYDDDVFPLPTNFSDPVTKEYLSDNGKAVKIQSLFRARCVDCHSSDGRSTDARKYDFDDIDKLKKYLKIEKVKGGMELSSLAQTTHVHLLAFSMLYTLTGLAFAFTGYPLWARAIIAPLPLIAQIVDISFWWIARFDKQLADVILITGGIVGASLLVQILLSLFDMYGKVGKMVVAGFVIIGALGMGTLHQTVIGPYLKIEKERAEAAKAAG